MLNTNTNTATLSIDTSIVIPTREKDGGVRLDDGRLHLFGTFEVVYRVAESLRIDRYSYLNLETRAAVKSPQKTTICFYENKAEVARRHSNSFNGESRCAALNSITTTRNQVNISSYFNYRNATVNYISISQEDRFTGTRFAAEMQIANFTLIHGDPSDYHSKYKDCSSFDTNSMSLPLTGQCICNTGFVSSNSGRILDKGDVCIPTIKDIGRYDGSSCAFFRECASGNCTGNICQSSGQLDLEVHNLPDDDNENEEHIPINSLAIPINSTNSRKGGFVVEPDSSLRLYGNSEVLIQLFTSTSVTRYTTLNLEVKKIDNTQFCLVSSNEIDIDAVTTNGYPTIIEKCPSCCIALETRPNEDSITLQEELIDLLKCQDTLEIDYFYIHREKSTNMDPSHDYALIDSIEILQDKTEDIIDGAGNCRDEHSYKIRSLNFTTGKPIESCLCFDGFRSNSGGKALESVYSSCIKCYEESDYDCDYERLDEPCTNVSISSSNSIQKYLIQDSHHGSIFARK